MKNPSFPDKFYPGQRNPTNYTGMHIPVFCKIFTPGVMCTSVQFSVMCTSVQFSSVNVYFSTVQCKVYFSTVQWTIVVSAAQWVEAWGFYSFSTYITCCLCSPLPTNKITQFTVDCLHGSAAAYDDKITYRNAQKYLPIVWGSSIHSNWIYIAFDQVCYYYVLEILVYYSYGT